MTAWNAISHRYWMELEGKLEGLWRRDWNALLFDTGTGISSGISQCYINTVLCIKGEGKRYVDIYLTGRAYNVYRRIGSPIEPLGRSWRAIPNKVSFRSYCTNSLIVLKILSIAISLTSTSHLRMEHWVFAHVTTHVKRQDEQ